MLTNAQLRKIKKPTGDKPEKYSDEKAMYLEAMPTGSMFWRLKFRINGKESRYTIGSYPEISLAEARARRDEARKLVAQGINPNHAKKEANSRLNNSNSFEVLASKWLIDRQPTVKPQTHRRDQTAMERDIYPLIGKMAIDKIKSPDILKVARKIEERGAAEMARRAISQIGGVIRLAMREGLADSDPTNSLCGSLKPHKVQHMARIPENELPELLNKIDNYQGDLVTRLGLKFMNLTFVRTVELRFAEWTEIDLNSKQWRIPAEKMKMGKVHIVPLSTQSIELLQELHQHTGQYKYIFFNATSRKPYSENAFLTALWRMGYKGRMTGHGFRGLASTILHEWGCLHDAIERQLAHTKTDKVSAAYDHSQHLEYRHKMMQDWANYLDNTRTAQLLQFTKSVI